jgi:hypothetical protein
MTTCKAARIQTTKTTATIQKELSNLSRSNQETFQSQRMQSIAIQIALAHG